MSRPIKPILLFAASFALLDQFSKYLVEKYLSETLIITRFFQLELSKNEGIAFGLDLPQLGIIIFTIVLIPLIIYFADKELSLKKTLSKIAIALILGGAIGNLIDRFTHGYVTDFIAIGPWPNFNLADTFIVIGVLLVIIFYAKIKR